MATDHVQNTPGIVFNACVIGLAFFQGAYIEPRTRFVAHQAPSIGLLLWDVHLWRRNPFKIVSAIQFFQHWSWSNNCSRRILPFHGVKWLISYLEFQRNYQSMANKYCIVIGIEYIMWCVIINKDLWIMHNASLISCQLLSARKGVVGICLLCFAEMKHCCIS